jgi:hypothetical protein
MDIGGGVGLRNRYMGGFRDGRMYGFKVWVEGGVRVMKLMK